MSALRICVPGAQYSLWRSNKFIFLSFALGIYIFEENSKSIQGVIGGVYCPDKSCLNSEKCESIGGNVTTPRSIYGCGKCGAWLFVHKVTFTLQVHVKTTKKTKHAFSWLKNMNLVPDKQFLLNVPFQSTKYRKKDLCVDNIKIIGDIFCPTCRKEKCVYISTNPTTSFYDCKKCKACCHVLNIPFKDQKPTIMLFGGDGTHCFARKTSRDYEKEKPSPFLKKLLRQSQPSTSEPEPKKVQIWSPKNMESKIRSKKWVQIWIKRIRYLLVDNWSNIFIFQIILFEPTVNRSILISELEEKYDLLSFQRRNPVDSRFWSPLCYYCSIWSRPKHNNQLTINTPSYLAIAVVSKTRLFGQ